MRSAGDAGSRRRVLAVAAVYVALDVAILLLLADHDPYVLVGLVTAVGIVHVGRAWRGRARRAARIAFGVMIALLFAEVGAVAMEWRAGRTRYEGPDAATYYRPDDDLGYAPKANARVEASRSRAGTPLYRVTYTTGADGWRTVPRRPTRGDAPVVACFGCSFTFGQGLGDDDAYPSQLQEALGDAAAVHNFGFHGYGPPQMLRTLEKDIHRQATGGRPLHTAVYLAIPDHVKRAAGRTRWNLYGPRYELDAEGRARYEGPISERAWTLGRDLPGTLFSFACRAAMQSAAMRQLASRIPWRTSEADTERYWAVVQAARDAVVRRDGGSFRMILWSEDPRDERSWRDEAQRRDITFAAMSDVIPGFADDPRSWCIRGDDHPSADACARLARWIAAHAVVR